MRRRTIRIVAIAAALTLGWWAGGAIAGSGGEDQGHGGHGEGGDAAVLAAEQLRLSVADDAPWYYDVVALAIGLFAAAVVLGYPTLKARGPEPVEEDDHGHDDEHAHSAAH